MVNLIRKDTYKFHVRDLVVLTTLNITLWQNAILANRKNRFSACVSPSSIPGMKNLRVQNFIKIVSAFWMKYRQTYTYSS